jgi:hypothetical protein
MSLEGIFELVRGGLETLVAAKTLVEWWEGRGRRRERDALDRAVAVWRRSTHSAARGCVEVAFLGGGHVAVRDSNASNGPVLRFSPREWHAFLDGVIDGQFELP